MKKVLVILGPTATGKTETALYLGKKFNGELVACDSRQVYKGLDVGTGKLPGKKVAVRKQHNFWLVDGVKVWMYDVTHLQKQYSAADYVKDASKIINQINFPIIVGGTGFYLKALLEGLDNLSMPVDQDLRIELEKLDLKQLQQKLQKLSKNRWNKLNDSDKKNPRRLLRSIEIIMYGHSSKFQTSNVKCQMWNTLKIGLTASRDILYKNVDSRIFKWFEDGIIYEVKDLLAKGITFDRFKELGLQYWLIPQYLNGQIKSEEELIKLIRGSLHSYVRRQQTWFKKKMDVNWFDITETDFRTKMELMVSKWYHTANA